MSMDVSFIPDFAILPPHIITHILRYLEISDFKKASTVCKPWYYASTDPQIEKNLIIAPTNANITEIQKTNRRYGVLRLHGLTFDKEDSHIEFFEKICPFVNELSIIKCASLAIHHLVKLLELSTSLKNFHLIDGHIQAPGLFPIDYKDKAKLVKNLSGIKQITIKQFINIPLIKDLVKCATNLDTFKFANITLPFNGPNEIFFTIFDNDNVGNLKNLQLNLNFTGFADDFIKCFINIKNLNLRWFKIVIPWSWEFEIYKSSLFQQFIMKLQSLDELVFCNELMNDQLSIICETLVNLKRLDCVPDKDQRISELENLKQLESLYCRIPLDTNIAEIDRFFQCKFQYLQKFQFDGFVTESNLIQLCENHPNLIELRLSNLLTRKLEIIFKHLIKLRVLTLRFGFSRLRTIPAENRYVVSDMSAIIDSDKEAEYNISRLVDLEEFYLQEHSIRANDLRKLKKLKNTNLAELLNRQNSLI